MCCNVYLLCVFYKFPALVSSYLCCVSSHSHPSPDPAPQAAQEREEAEEPHRKAATRKTDLPIATIKSLMRRELGPTTKIAEDASDSMLECVAEFISFIVSEAAEKTMREHRKTLAAEVLPILSHSLLPSFYQGCALCHQRSWSRPLQ